MFGDWEEERWVCSSGWYRGWCVWGLGWVFSNLWDRGCESAMVAVVGGRGCDGGVLKSVSFCRREA